MNKSKDEAEKRLARFIDNAFYDDDNFLLNNQDVLKELHKARNKCLKVLGFEQRKSYSEHNL